MVPIYHPLFELKQTGANDEDVVKIATAIHELRRRFARYSPTKMVAMETITSVEGSGTSEFVGLPPLRLYPFEKMLAADPEPALTTVRVTLFKS
jgi:hypothetical protein